MKIGDLYQSKRRHLATRNQDAVAQVTKTWNKRDIDPECPESVAIIGMVQFVVWLEGEKTGPFNHSRRLFNRNYERLEKLNG